MQLEIYYGERVLVGDWLITWSILWSLHPLVSFIGKMDSVQCPLIEQKLFTVICFQMFEYMNYIDVKNYSKGNVNDLAKLLQKELNNVIHAKGDHRGWPYAGNVKAWNKEVFSNLGKNRNDIKVKGRSIIITNSN